MTQEKNDLSGVHMVIGGRPVVITGSASIGFDKVEEEEELIFNKTSLIPFECSVEANADSSILTDFFSCNDRHPVQVRVEHKPIRIPRKIKKAHRTLWRGTHWQNKAEFWYARNFYYTINMGNMTIDKEGNCTIEGSGRWTDSRYQNEIVMSSDGIERLMQMIKNDYPEQIADVGSELVVHIEP